jgi:short-subunit dehydrogenase
MEQTITHTTGQTAPYVLITGATGGLGKAFAVECACRGWNLCLTDLSPTALELLAAGLHNTYHVMVVTLACDLTDPLSRSALFTQVHERGLRLSMLVNVAGLDFEGPFIERSRQQIRTLLRLNIEGTVEITHAMLELRDARVPFRILNVASLAAYSPMPVKAAYAASKRFLLDFSLALREELRPSGTTVTVLCPAGMPTTRENIEGIEVQGLMGLLTTQNVGTVAGEAIDAALAGQAVCIPGLANRLLQSLSALLPGPLSASLLGARWMAAYARRSDLRLPS